MFHEHLAQEPVVMLLPLATMWLVCRLYWFLQSPRLGMDGMEPAIITCTSSGFQALLVL